MHLARLAFLFLLSASIGGCLVWTADDDDSAVASDDDDAVGDDDDAVDEDGDGDGVTEADGDCDDEDPTVYPGADEVCNEADDDCDGDIDEGVTLLTFRPDGDGDGYPTGNAGGEVQGCSAPDGYVESIPPYDCADSLATVFPGADETCNGVDDNCDGTLDEGVKVDLYVDNDLDGYGAGSAVGLGCPGVGYSAANDDCDDFNAQLNHDDADGDGFSGCDGDCDDDSSGIVPGQDADGDGKIACADDCDDLDPAVYAGAPEACNGTDDDCDGAVDNGLNPALVIRGAGAAAGTQVRSVLTSGGYCVAPVMEATALTSLAQISWYQLIVVTADTGDINGWFNDPYPIYEWYWSWTGGGGGSSGPALIGMGVGGMAVLEWIGSSADYGLSLLTTASGGVVQAADASTPLWSTPNQVLTTGSAVTVHTQSFASTSPLTTNTSGGLEVLGTTTSGQAVITRTPAWTGQTAAYYWGFDQGLNLATAAGQQLFQNMVYGAIGPP